MSPYMRRFVYAALFYLTLAALFGLANGLLKVTYFGTFAHTHFSLLGFMAMIVFGIGYFILPRFNGTDLRFPGWVAVHFWLANITLIGMVVFRGLAVNTLGDRYHLIFVVCAIGQAISLFMFVINIVATLNQSGKPTGRKEPSGTAPVRRQEEAGKSIRLTADTKVADLIETRPDARQILVAAGLQSLAIPGHLQQVKAMGVTLGMAAARHGLPLENLLVQLNRPPSAAGSQAAAQAVSANLSPDLLVGTVLEQHPESREVFERHFGSGCFDCPGQSYESIDMACRMHGVDPESFLKELNATIAAT